MSGRARGSCSDVWAVRVAINRASGLDLQEYGYLNWLPGDLVTGYAAPMEVARRRDVDGSKRRSVSQPSLVLSRERKRKGYNTGTKMQV